MKIHPLYSTSVALCAVVYAATALAQPAFDKSFDPDIIGPGSVTTLTFEITSSDPLQAVTELTFTDNLPAGVTVADFADVASTCDGDVTAPAGGTTISFAGGRLAPASTCTVSLNVTSDTAGTYTNVTGDLTSTAGNSGTAAADLTVNTNGLPGFSKRFDPASVSFGNRSTLTFLIDNTANAEDAYQVSFTDVLPPGMVIADPNHAATDCGQGVFDAPPGGSVITYNDTLLITPSLDAGTNCVVTVDVIGNAVGLLGNVTGNLLSTSTFNGTLASSGRAAAALEVTTEPVLLIKEFIDDPAPAGGTTTLRFTIQNRDRDFAAHNISFTDDLDAVLGGLVATGLPLANPCGAGSTLTGTSLLTLTGGSLLSGESCTFDVPLQVPPGALSGAYANTTGAVIADLGGNPFTGNEATDLLFVSPSPRLTQSFVDDPVGAGGVVTLEFTITNTSTTSSAADIGFTEEFDGIVPTPFVLPPDGFCGAGATADWVPATSFDPPSLQIAGASLDAGASCTFDVSLDVAVGAPSGTTNYQTSEISAAINGATLTGPPASDTLTVYGAPRLQKEFIDDPTAPGGTATLRFTLVNPSSNGWSGQDASGITFTDDLNAALAGLTAVGLPVANACGPGNGTLTGSAGDTLLTFSGGNLAPATSCAFEVVLDVPANALPTAHTNTTSDVTATVGGVATAGSPATDDLLIAGLTLTKSFTDDPVIAGGTVTLEFTIDNTSTTLTATDIAFRDDLDAVLMGLSGSGVTTSDVCGPANGTIVFSSGDTLLAFMDGTLGPGESCTFSTTLQVPAATASDTYNNTTTNQVARINGTFVELEPAIDSLVVSSGRLMLTKKFTDDPVAPGGNVNLRFTLTNLDNLQSATNIEFTDDLDAALTGLVSTNGTLNDICSAGSQITGTSLLTFNGGVLAPSESCSFDVPLSVPAGVPLGTTATNMTSMMTGTIGGLAVDADAAIDTLQIASPLNFSKSFDSPAIPGGPAVLTFTIENTTAGTVQRLGFTDDLDAALTGLETSGLPVSDVCGAGSTLAGTAFLTLTNGGLPPGESCTFSVNLDVPGTASPGDYLNTTSDLFADGFTVAGPATDSLTILALPVLPFSKAFQEPAMPGGRAVLSFTIENVTAATISGVGFTDDLDAVLPGLAASGLPKSGVCGAGSTLDGTSSLSLVDGRLLPGEICTFSVNLDVPAATTAGEYLNTTGTLLANGLPVGDPAADTLTVNAAPAPNYDTDRDGVPNGTDACPGTVAGAEVNARGCSCEQLDDDNDNVNNCDDACPDDSAKSAPGLCGCGVADVDSDQDGVPDCNDLCPDTAIGTDVDISGCPVEVPVEPPPGQPVPEDDDGDGVANGDDLCPDTPTGSNVDADGCPSDDGTDGGMDGTDDPDGTTMCGVCGNPGMVGWISMVLGWMVLRGLMLARHRPNANARGKTSTHS